MNNSPIDIFSQRKADFQVKIDTLSKKSKTIGWVRVVLFLCYVGLSIYFLSSSKLEMVLLSSVVFMPLFGWLVKVHNAIRFDVKQLSYLIEINEDEVKRCNGQLKEVFDGGFVADPLHPYAIDMDVFGRNSLFQLLNRSRLSGANDLLADWLLNHANEAEIKERQEVVHELSADMDFRQTLTAYSYHHQDSPKGLSHLAEWLKTHFNNVDRSIYKILKYILPLVSVVMLFGWMSLGWSYRYMLIPVLLNMLVLRGIFIALLDFTKEFEQVHKKIKSYRLAISLITDRSFVSERLVYLQSQLKDAPKAIKELDQILHFLQGRSNVLYHPVNLMFLLDMHGFHAALKWKNKYEDQIDAWLMSFHEVMVLSDLACYAYANDEYAFPEVSVTTQQIKAKSLGHPLIHREKRVTNDFTHSSDHKVALVTGSNMSGKSTFLRTVGVNLVLAQMGAPVCAAQFEFSSQQLFSSMRTQDNLEESVSSFYAELKRLKQLLDYLQEGRQMYFMLDEILKGTNSEDRHKGAMALIDQLIEANSIGMISTHDIELSEMSKSESRIINYSFNSTIEGDDILFNYQLTDGACRSFNASKLMEKMGVIKS